MRSDSAESLIYRFWMTIATYSAQKNACEASQGDTMPPPAPLMVERLFVSPNTIHTLHHYHTYYPLYCTVELKYYRIYFCIATIDMQLFILLVQLSLQLVRTKKCQT